MVFIASFQLLICGFSLLIDKVVQETAGIIGIEIGNFLVLIQLNIFRYEAICLRFCHLFFLVIRRNFYIKNYNKIIINFIIFNVLTVISILDLKFIYSKFFKSCYIYIIIILEWFLNFFYLFNKLLLLITKS